MANPTSTVNLSENTGYVWADGDVYEIAQTDEVEGAAQGASFSGLGVDNQPHQVLLNKAKLLHTQQLTDVANIAEPLGFTGLAAGSTSMHSNVVASGTPLQTGSTWNGLAAFATTDFVHGFSNVLLEWGVYQYGVELPVAQYEIGFPLAVGVNGLSQIVWVGAWPVNPASNPAFNGAVQVGAVGPSSFIADVLGGPVGGIAWLLIGWN